MQVEHPNDESLQLQFDEPTVGFLGELFSSPLPPYTYKSTVSSSDGAHVEDVLADAFKRLDEKAGNDFLAENVLWSEEDIAGVKRKLTTLVARSSVFRYFFRTYSMKWLACARIQLDGKRLDMVKGRYCVIRDMSKGRAGAPILRSLNPFSRGIALELELDGVGVGEVDHTTVQAPAGTYLSPSAKVKGSGKRVGWFSIKDDLSVRTELDTDLSGGPEAHAWGMLTPGHATVKTKKDWADLPDKRPLRRLPVDGSAEHRYLLSLNIAPRLGMRALGHLALFGLSALAFLMVWLNPELLSDSADTFSLGTLLVVASMLITALSSREEESYVRKLLFRLPQFLSVTCIAVDVVGFVYFLVAGLLASSSCDFLPPVLLGNVACAGFAVCAISFMWFLVWAANCTIRKLAWTIRPGAFETFKVQFHAIGAPRNIAISQD